MTIESISKNIHIGWNIGLKWILANVLGLGVIPKLYLLLDEIRLRPVLGIAYGSVPDTILNWITLVIGMVLIGILQHLVQREYVSQIGKWWILSFVVGVIVVNTAGYSIVLIAGGMPRLQRVVYEIATGDKPAPVFFFPDEGDYYDPPGEFVEVLFAQRYQAETVVAVITQTIFGISVGICIGAGQYFILRKRIRRAAWWVLANIIGWGISMAVYETMRRSVYKITFERMWNLWHWLIPITIGAISGAILGVITGIALIELLRWNAVEQLSPHSSLSRLTT